MSVDNCNAPSRKSEHSVKIDKELAKNFIYEKNINEDMTIHKFASKKLLKS